MYQESKRVEFLDSLRGLAALFVLFSHLVGAFAWPASYVAMLNWPFVSILFNGKEAVAMFFVLSGYVLSRPYVENHLKNAAQDSAIPRRQIFLPTFYLRRFIRIWPPWFFVFVLSIVARKYLFFQPITHPAVSFWLAGFWQAPLTVSDFFRQCAFLLHDPSRQLLNQDWSLGVELKGSLLVPLFVYLMRPKFLPWILPVAVLLLIGVWTGEYYISFLIGVLLARYQGAIDTILGRWHWLARLATLIVGLTLYQGFAAGMWMFGGSQIAYKYGWTVTAIGCGVILISVFSSRTLQRWLNLRPFVFLGKISYSLYLLQFVIILCLLPPLLAFFNHWGNAPGLLLFAGTNLAGVTTTIGCAAGMYFLVEVRVINFGHWLTKKIQARYQK